MSSTAGCAQLSFTRYVVSPVQSKSWQPWSGCSRKVLVHRAAPVHGSNALAWFLPVTITIGRLVIADDVTNMSPGLYTVEAPVRRPSNVWPGTGPTLPCQMTSPVTALSPTTEPSDHFVITTETLPPAVDFSTDVIETTSLGQLR